MNRTKYLVLWLSTLLFPNWGNTSTKHLERNTFFYQKIKTLKEDLYLQLNLSGEAMPITFFEMATDEVMPTGSYIINMSVQPQTEENGLKPYGLIWELLNIHRIPVKWIIRTGKGKDEVDFTYNSIDFRGGPFIIPADYRTTAVNNTINFWEGEGVEGLTINTAITVPVERTLTHSLKWALDDKNGKIAEKYLEMGGIPSTAYDFIEPANLDCCSDLFVIPHANPDWDSHQNLLNWTDRLENGGCRGNIWMGCQAVSNVENLVNPSNNLERLNFLMNNPLSPSENPAIDHGDHDNGNEPYQYSYHDHPIMQFIGLTDGAQEGGSEQIYLPSNGWRSSTSIGIWDNNHEDVPSLSSGPAAKIAFGPAFGDTNRGAVLYEGGHTLDGNDPENIAAIRAFFNFSFIAANDRAIKVTGNVPLVMNSQVNYTLNGTATGGAGTYNYQWTTSCGGTFANTLAANTNFTPPDVTTATDCILQLTVTDDCGNRFGYYVRKVQVNPASNPIISCPYLSTVSNAVPTHTTIADGSWNNSATWQGGNIPNGNLSGSIVNIQNNVTRANNVAIGAGMLNILGTLTISNDNFTINNTGARLNVDHGAIIISNGNFELLRGALTLNYGGVQICNGNYIDDSFSGTNGNGYIYTANGDIEDRTSGSFSNGVAWCASGNGVGLPTNEDCSIANPSGGCLAINYYKTLCTRPISISNSTEVRNEVWLDLNANSLRDPLEIGIENLPVCITNKASFLLNGILQPINAYQDTVLTDATGVYVFNNLPDCDNWEIVAHNAPSLYTPTYDADGGLLGTINFNLSNGVVSATNNVWCDNADCLEDLDFGFSLAGDFELSGTICLDDGSKDGTCGTGGEEKVSALDLLLFDDKGTFFGGVSNETNGTYLFPFLPEDKYIVSLNTKQKNLDTFLFTTKAAATPAEEILITTAAIFQKVSVLADVIGVDYAFISHAANQNTVIANDDIFSFCPGLGYGNWVIANDTVIGAAYFFSAVVMPQKGTLTFNNNGTFQYLPSVFECGTDEFRYRLCDLTSGDCDTAKVTLIFEDTSIPSLSNIPDDFTLSCDELLPGPALVSTFDNCPRINIDIKEKSTQGDDGCSQYDYELQRTWTATDLCGNVNSETQSIRVQDVVAPNIFRIYTLPNGKKLVAGVTQFVGERWKTVPLPIDFTTKPLVFSQIMTQTDATPAITQVRNVSKAQFELRLKQEEAATQVHGREKVAWIAIEQGGQATDYQLIANTIGIGSNAETIDFVNDFPTIPAFFTAQQTTDEPDPTVVHYQNLTTSAVTLNLKEELSKDGEIHHNKEEVAYLGLENIGNLTNTEGVIIGESGILTTNNEWTTIPLNHTYYNPIVIVNHANAVANFPTIIQVNNVTTTSFDVRIAAWDYLSTMPTNTPINYLVIEGSVPLYIPTFCDTGDDDLIIGQDMIAIDNCDNSVELGYSEMKRFNNGEQVIDRTWQSADECGNEVIYNQKITCEGIAVKIKTYLQGALVGSDETGLMRDDLRTKSLIPPKEPYSFLTGFQHFGNGGGEVLLPELLEIQGANAIVDWVLIEIRSRVDRKEIIATSAGLVQRDGDVISATGDSLIVFENVPYGDYFVGVRHRNHIGVITKEPYSFALNNIPEIDFRNVFTPTEGKRPGIQIDGKSALWSGDLNGDGKTIYQGPKNDPFEMFLSVILDAENEHFLVNYINRGYTHRDFNLDGQVIFQGPNNDRSNLLFNTILAHPDNTKFLANFIVIVAPE